MRSKEKASPAYSTRKRSMWQEALHRLSKNPTAMTGLAVLVIVTVFCLCAKLICPEGYDAQDIMNKFRAPSTESVYLLFGTDNLGRSMLARVLYGGQYSLLIGFSATIVAAILGITLGAIAGFYGGAVDNVIMRTLDILHALPNLLLAIAISAVMGGGIFNCIMAIGIASVPGYARTVRGPILAIKEKEFVEAARALDAKDSRIIFNHIIPNVLSPIIVHISQGVSACILDSAALSFLGLGVQAPMPEWGALLSQSRQFIREYPYLVFIPGVAIALVVLSMNLFGDGLRDALDPKLKY